MEYIKIIEKKLKEKNITAKKMLLDLGYSDSLISTWKKGSKPTIDKLYNISQYLNTNIDYMITGTRKETELDSQEQELLQYFRKLTEKEQAKELARLEILTEERTEQNNQTQTKLSS